MPPAGQTAQFDGEWTGAWERYVVQDVVPWAGRHLPLEAGGRGRTLAGFSAGAYGSVDMGLRHPGLFGTLESWSGYFRAPRDGSLANATHPSAQTTTRRRSWRPTRPSCARAGSASSSPPAAGSARCCSPRATSPASWPASALEHVLDVTAGGHHGGTWRAVLPMGLRYAFAR